MEWYYAENNERRGPLAEAEFQELVRNGRIMPDTQVWREGWIDWRKLSEAGDLSNGANGNVDGATSTALCAECRGNFPTSEMLQYSGAWVCPTCKPIFFQKVKEGIEPTLAMQYGGFWIRFLAKFVDRIIAAIASYMVQIPLYLMIGTDKNNPSLAIVAGLVSWVVGFSIEAAYSISLTGKYGATLGKMACGLRVVTAQGHPVGYAVATGRFFAEMLSGLLLCIGYIMAAFDDERRTLHDRICNTRVIRTRA